LSKKTIRGVLYGRYSGGSRQREKDVSIEQQFEDCRRFCAASGIDIVAEYADRALSGRYDTRPEFQRMMADAGKRGFSVIVCWKSDRFARNKYDAVVYKRKLKLLGVRVLSAKEHIPDGPEGIILESMLEGMAEYYSANLAQNVRRGMDANAALCKVNGRCPLGYRRGRDGKYEIDPDAATVVEGIFRDYASGMSSQRLAQKLNLKGARTATGGKFTKNSFHSIFDNERYMGVYTYKDVRIEGGVPAIVSKEIFEKVRKMRNSKKQSPARGRMVDYALTGKMRCGLCGATMAGTTGTGKNDTVYHYYSCSGQRKHTGCEKTSIPQQYIEGRIDAILREVLTDANIAKIAAAAEKMQEDERETSKIEKIRSDIRKAEKAVENLLDAIEDVGADPKVRERLLERQAQKADLEEELGALTTGPIIDQAAVSFWLEQVKAGTSSETGLSASLLDIFVRSVRLFEDKVVIVCRLTADETLEIEKPLNETEESEGVVFAFASSGGPNVLEGEIRITRCLVYVVTDIAA
jgi:DNA invertase Pin-like site-specific DNA recombinase